MSPRHFLSLLDLEPVELASVVERAAALRRAARNGMRGESLSRRVLAMIFEKSSTRTRVSFETAMVQLGGQAIFMSPADSQLGRGEPVEDTARVLSRMVDAVTIRTFEQEKVERFAAHATIPVINALTDDLHPCQLLADVQTFLQHRGSIAGRTVAWIGDGNNMCNSYINAARQFDFKLRIGCPPGYGPDADRIRRSGAEIVLVADAGEAAEGADLVATDVWASMGQEDEQVQRAQEFMPFQVTAAVMARARSDALFMHCLPAHRGEEVAAAVIDGPRSVVWDEAENRLHSQKALLEFLLCPR